jgi:hypothetical protein
MIFGQDYEFPSANRLIKRDETIDGSRSTPQALKKKDFVAFCSYRNDTKTIFLQPGNKSEYVIIFHLT